MHRFKISIIPSLDSSNNENLFPKGNEKLVSLFIAKLEEILHLR